MVLGEGHRQSWRGLRREAGVSVGHWSDVLGRLSLWLISSIKAMEKKKAVGAPFN